MKLLLIRHGETVDNVAQVYAGVTDSALTAHGTAQAARLATHLATILPPATHVFSSDLSRARKTAEATLCSQRTSRPPVLVQLPLLREQDYGSLERCTFSRRNDSGGLTNGPKGPLNGNRAPIGPDGRKDSVPGPGDPRFRAVESRASVSVRASAFVDGYLASILLDEDDDAAGKAAREEAPDARPQTETRSIGPPMRDRRRASAPATLGALGVEHVRESVVFVFAHGMLLSSLWRALLERFGSTGVTLGPNIAIGATGGGSRVTGGGGSGTIIVRDIWHLGPWSNTGFLELRLRRLVADRDPTDLQEPKESQLDKPSANPLADWGLRIVTINSTDHLRGLKRTGGGVGSSAADDKQRSIDSFFVKRARTK